MASTSFLVLFAMLLGGGSDLLDYVPSQDYWQAKGVADVTADGLVKDLAPPKAVDNITRLIVLDAVLKMVPRAAVVPAGGAPKGPDPAALRKEAVGEFIKVADRVGNIRLDGITVGVSGDMGPNAGYGVVVAHGRYDAAAVS